LSLAVGATLPDWSWSEVETAAAAGAEGTGCGCAANGVSASAAEAGVRPVVVVRLPQLPEGVNLNGVSPGRTWRTIAASASNGSFSAACSLARASEAGT